MDNTAETSPFATTPDRADSSTALFHKTAMIFMCLSSVAGALISGYFSRKLVTYGIHVIHAHTAFMGFGVFMVTGHLLRHANTTKNEISAKSINATTLYIELMICVIATFAGFLIIPHSEIGLYMPVLSGLYLTGRFTILCFQLYKHTGLRGLKTSYSKMSSRFFATSLFMMMLACGQLSHICINLIKPILPFSGNLMLKHNYLAFSFPISLCIMGCVYDAIERKSTLAVKSIPTWWNVHYFLLVGGVFSLFFTILFSPWIPGNIPIFMSVFFSFVLVISIIVFWRNITGSQKQFKVFSILEWKYFISAAYMLSMAGIAGLMLGYRWPEDSPIFYFFLQGHMHLALAGWACFGMLGTIIKNVFPISGYQLIEKLVFAALHAGILLLISGILIKTPFIRSAGGIMFAAVFAYIGLKLNRPSCLPIANHDSR